MAGDDALGRGFRALQSWRWQEARDAFEESIARRESPEALEGLASAAGWLDDATTMVTSRERAYGLYRDQQRNEAAAAVAAQLGIDILNVRGDAAVASGWLARARDLVRDQRDSPVHAMISGIEAAVAVGYRRDLPEARRLTEEALAAARRVGQIDAQMMATAQLGLIGVESGEVDEGLRLLDLATTAAVAGEVKSTDMAVRIACFLVTACLELRDLDRAAQWSSYAMHLSRGEPSFGLFDYPRTEHAAVLVFAGRWPEAEAELGGVIADAARRPVAAANARLRLADLRRRQGRLAEANALLDSVEAERNLGGLESLVLQARAEIALDAADPVRAASLAERVLRSLPPAFALRRSDPLKILARARTATGQTEAAEAAATELASIAARFGTHASRAAAAMAAAGVAAMTSNVRAAREGFEDAVSHHVAAGTPFEAARARLELARTLRTAGEADAAVEEARAARDTARSLGARGAFEEAERFLRETRTPEARQGAMTLTRRETEILRLLAEGRSNEEVAEVLVLSVRTIERHVSNIYAKLGATGRTARAVAIAYAHAAGVV
jgi:DNA-binding NarL/FixJ family response regulator